MEQVERDIEEVRQANESFYEAFEKLDIQRMDALWVKEDHVKCIHPGWEVRIGWQEVLIFQVRQLPFAFAECVVSFRVFL